jgi:transposase InsO family protein
MRGEHAVLPWPDAVGTHHADDIRAPVLRELIAPMARENPLWGIPRIRAELALLGHCVARSTVAKYAGREFGPPSQTWSVFIRNHLDSTAAMDFFTVPTVTGGWLYCFIVLAHDRRRILHYNVTQFPTASWVARQLAQAFPFDTTPRYLIHDNDGIFGEEVSRTLQLLKIEEVRTSPGSPWMNAYVERFIGSIRRECLDHVIVFNERHSLGLVGEYGDYYHTARTHESLECNAPQPRTIEGGNGQIVAEPMVGGLHHRYRRAA